MNTTQIVITGMGAETPYGHGVPCFWEGIVTGRSVISSMDLFDLQGLACTQAGVIRDLPLLSGSPSRATTFATLAAEEALQQANLTRGTDSWNDCALLTASNFAEMDRGEAALIPSDCPGYDPKAAAYAAPGQIAVSLQHQLGLNGYAVSLSLSCASGAAALAEAAEWIRNGLCTRVLVIGVDAHSRFSWSGLCSLRTMTKEKVRPFDVNRNGTIFSEGAAALLLEEASAAAARGAKPLAYLTGWATGNNGHHLTAPAPRGAGSCQVMRGALALAGLSPAEVSHFNAHGTGTHANDITEAEAIHDLFGDYAPSLPVTSIKGAVGHLLGAAGTAEAIASVLTLQKDIIPPTANCESPDPACNLDVVRSARPFTCQHILSNSAGFGGCNAALLFSKVPAYDLITPDPVPISLLFSGINNNEGVDALEVSSALQEEQTEAPGGNLFPLQRFALPDGARPVVGENISFAIEDYLDSKKPYLDFACKDLLAACSETLIDVADLRQDRIGLFVGTTWGCTETAQRFFEDYVRKGPRLVKPMLFPHTYANTAISLAAMEWSIKGAHANFTPYHTASIWAFISALCALRGNRTEAAIVAGTDTLSIPRVFAQNPNIAAGEGAAAICLRTGSMKGHPRLRSFGIGKTREEAIEKTLQRAMVKTDAIGLWVTTSLLPNMERCKQIVVEPYTGDLSGASFVTLLALVTANFDEQKDSTLRAVVAETSEMTAVALVECSHENER